VVGAEAEGGGLPDLGSAGAAGPTIPGLRRPRDGWSIGAPESSDKDLGLSTILLAGRAILNHEVGLGIAVVARSVLGEEGSVPGTEGSSFGKEASILDVEGGGALVAPAHAGVLGALACRPDLAVLSSNCWELVRVPLVWSRALHSRREKLAKWVLGCPD
jgi:hypothetical protein